MVYYGITMTLLYGIAVTLLYVIVVDDYGITVNYCGITMILFCYFFDITIVLL